ncbi:hypothetical protein CAQU_11260 [Corynebacterium aquilae DSM 44791]|uniref:Chemotaxis methyl-accepting receptor HlyB-like 4HB MCP domain-containing protein n=1 Tax=Corynebacterium aquilae DSM 44791 TaxID=1431546 RepID=A0A1L7CI78_9CORY|nr:hypothetical protein CAQU_11260 [Corynebacterium aquilae DSM 44791]
MGSDPTDQWIEAAGHEHFRQRHPALALAQETFIAPLARARRTASFFTTSPGVITLVTVIITVGILAAGLSMAQSSVQRQQQLDMLITNAEPMSYSAHNVYTSLSIANTAATTGFVQAGVEDQLTRARYTEAIKRAGESLAETAAGMSTTQSRSSDEHALALIIDIQQQLNIYVGLVETARANNRAGNPVGAAYLSEASTLMRERILPAASDLFVLTTGEVMTKQSNLSKPQWVPISGLVAALVMLALGQIWLSKKTRRRLNKGFVTATALMFVALMWVGSANYVTWKAGTEGFAEAAAPLNSLTNARIRAEQAHTQETLALVLRQEVGASGNDFGETIRTLNRALDEFEDSSLGSSSQAIGHVYSARSAIDKWVTAHEQLVKLLAAGKYQEALPAATGLGEGSENSSAAAFHDLDENLATLIADARASLRAYIRDGVTAARAVPAVVLILSFVSVVALWLGIRPRLQEYL